MKSSLNLFYFFMEMFLRRHSKAVLVTICVVSLFIMGTVSVQESAIVDELAHIPAGYAYVHYLDYRLNPEHPPLLKALAVLPLSFLKLNYPLTNPFWTTAVNGEWGVGGAFLYGLGNSAAMIINLSRIIPMLLTIALIVFAYFWARKLFGPVWALLPAVLLGLSPIILAQGHYVTTDIAAAFGTIIGLFTFVQYIDNPTRKNLWIAGLCFGVAELMKFSTVLLIPVFILLMLVYYLVTVVRDWKTTDRGQRFKVFFKRGLRSLGALIAIFAIGTVLIIYPVYALFTAHYPQAKQISDTNAIIGYLAAGSCSVSQWANCVAKVDISATHYDLTRPMAQFVLGVLMVEERLTGTNASYFLGYVYQYGSHLYFPVTYGLKETIPTLIIVLFGLFYGIFRAAKAIVQKNSQFGRYVLEHFAQFAMIIFVAVYWAASIESPLNIGVRHLLPTIPLIYLLATSAAKKYFDEARAAGRSPIPRNTILIEPISKLAFSEESAVLPVFSGSEARFSPQNTSGIPRENISPLARKIRGSSCGLILRWVLGLLLLWLAGETAFAYPYYTSYFNELGGGTMNGYRYITDSNYDWGQDMLRLQTWMAANPQVNKLALDFFGASNPSYYLGDKYVPWDSTMGDPADQGIHWLAISINQLQLAIQPPAGATSTAVTGYQWLLDSRPKEPGMGGVPAPDYRVGTTIFIYKL